MGLIIVYLVIWRIGLIFGWLGVRFGPSGPPSILIWNWVAVAGICAFVLFIERRGLASIGLGRPKIMDFVWAAVFWVVATLFTGFVHTLAPPPPNEGLGVMLSLSIPVLLAVVATAAITEEVVYRGYIIERLGELTGVLWIGALISFLLFIVPHVNFFGPGWLIYHSWGAIAIYALYIWRRNLWACMVLHLLQNSLILVPALGLAD